MTVKKGLLVFICAVLFLCIALTVATLFLPFRTSTAPLPEGVRYYSRTFEDPIQTAHVIEIERKQLGQQLQLTGTLGVAGLRQTDPLTTIVAPLQGQLVAAMNGTWFSDSGQWTGLLRAPLVMDGVLLRAEGLDPNSKIVGVTEEGEPWLAQADVRVFLTVDGTRKVRVWLNAGEHPRGIVLHTREALGLSSKSEVLRGTDFPLSVGKNLILRNVKGAIAIPLTERDEATSLVVRAPLLAAESIFPGEAVLSMSNEFIERNPDIGKELKAGAQVRISVQAVVTAQYAGCSLNRTQLTSKDTSLLITGGAVYNANLESRGPPLGRQTLPAKSRQPQTAICWNNDTLYLVVVDGFRFAATSIFRTALKWDRSVGMSYDEMEKFLKEELGCTCGLALDGGKSSTMMLREKVVNKPAKGKQHPISGAVVLVERKS